MKKIHFLIIGALLLPATEVMAADITTNTTTNSSLVTNAATTKPVAAKPAITKAATKPLTLPVATQPAVPPLTKTPKPTSSATAGQTQQVSRTEAKPTITPQQNPQQTQMVAPKPLVQLELDIGKNTKYSVFSLPNPPRLVVDLRDGSVKTEFDKASLAHTPIKKIRTAKHGDNMLRIVFDLEKNLTFTTKEEVLALNGATKANDNGKKRLIITLITK